MDILIAGASGATGRLLAKHLLDRGHQVRIIVRSPDKLPEPLLHHDRVTVVEAALLHLSDADMVRHVRGCAAVASCLGHNLTWKGLYGHPRRLVTEATRRLCEAIRTSQPEKPVKFVLMNTAGNSNRDLIEPLSLGEKAVLGVIRTLLPPHADNENAADFLRVHIGPIDKNIEWVVVRPDTLIAVHEVSAYEVHPSPTRSALFHPGRTSRINVAHFMADLITDDDSWKKWKGQMPVIYNKDSA